MHARNIGRYPGEEPEGLDRLVHAHAAAIEHTRALIGGGFEELGFNGV